MHNIWFKFNYADYLIFFVYFFLFKTVARQCKVVCISNIVAEHVKGKLGVKSKNIKVIHNGIPHEDFPLSKQKCRQSLFLTQEEFIILFVGRLEKQKNVETLLKALGVIKDKISNIRCLIIGEGSKKSELTSLCEELNITDKVSFLGTKKNPETYFKACDLFVLPSIFEGLGIVILEAFRASVPVVATNIEGPKELIQDKINGLLFEPQDYKQLAAIIENVYNNEQLRNSIAKNGYDSFSNKFNINNYATELEKVYLSR